MEERKELDLLDILSYTLNYISRKKITILLIFVVTIGLSLIYDAFTETEYESELIIITNTADYTLVEQIAAPLEKAIRYDNLTVSARLLEVDEEVARKINSIEVAEVEPHPAERVDGCTFSITLRSNDITVFDEVAEAFNNYFNNNSFIRNITSVHLESLKDLHSETLLQIQRLDSIQKGIPEAMKPYKQERSAISDLNLGTMYNQMIDLKKVETETLEKISLIQEFKIISDFTLVYATKGIIYYILIGVIAGFGINLIVFVLLTLKYLLKSKSED